MTKEECEKIMAEKFKEIVEVYKQYNPEGSYLDLTYSVNKDGKFMYIRNAYFDSDTDHPIDRFIAEYNQDAKANILRRILGDKYADLVE